MIESLARAGEALDEPRYRAAARAAADFLLTRLRDANGRLLHCWRCGQAKQRAMLDDYASLIGALATLQETQGSERWRDEAVRLADDMLAHFRDPQHGDLFYTADDQPPLVVPRRISGTVPYPAAAAWPPRPSCGWRGSPRATTTSAPPKPSCGPPRPRSNRSPWPAVNCCGP